MYRSVGGRENREWSEPKRSKAANALCALHSPAQLSVPHAAFALTALRLGGLEADACNTHTKGACARG